MGPGPGFFFLPGRVECLEKLLLYCHLVIRIHSSHAVNDSPEECGRSNVTLTPSNGGGSHPEPHCDTTGDLYFLLPKAESPSCWTEFWWIFGSVCSASSVLFCSFCSHCIPESAAMAASLQSGWWQRL